MSALAVVGRPADHDTDDLDLVAGVRAGDDRAFEALYLRYQARITAYVRGMVNDHGRAEDITQEVFMSALRRMRGTDAPIAFKPWIYEIAKNACIDSWRRSRNANEVSFDAQDALGADDHGRLADPGVTPHSAIDNKDALDNLCGAFGGLSPMHHEILVMREFEGLSYREIGERLGMSRPGVESTLFRARRRLSEEYEELVSGERCLRVQRIIDSSGGRASGVRDQRRMDRHLSHCQPCRRYARLAGVDLGVPVPARPAAAAAAKIAAWFPLPLFVRRRWGGEDAGQFVAQSHHGPLAQWTTSLAGTFDPSLVSGWSKAIATAATVAVAGVGAGAAIRVHHGDPGAGAKRPAAATRAPGQGSARGGHGVAAGRGSVAAKHGARAATHGDRAGGAADTGAAPVVPRLPAAGVTGSRTGTPGAVTRPAQPDRAAGGTTAPTAPANRPAGAAPSSSTTAAPPPAAIGHVIDALGTPAAAATGSAGTPAAGSAPTAPVETAVGSTTDLVTNSLAAPETGSTPVRAPIGDTPPAAAPEALQGVATALVATVTGAVTSTLAPPAPGRATP
ncbi:MAG TPA: sigma-70 family RNA polymerase sigma factor [Solirubrobacteraceae bacterium]|nr:sigma-70 family RNA polymerase sigma factor [Solirubrobacteraceae bacterium]